MLGIKDKQEVFPKKKKVTLHRSQGTDIKSWARYGSESNPGRASLGKILRAKSHSPTLVTVTIVSIQRDRDAT